MHQEIKEIQSRLNKIEARNKRVELDKAWETSLIRRLIIIILTYFVITVFFYFAHIEKPLINAIVPALAFSLSTLGMPYLKKLWLKNKK